MLQIVKDTNPLLREISKDVKFPLSKEDSETLRQMSEFLKDPENNACGLSAIQIGIKKRLVCIRRKRPDGSLLNLRLANPRIISRTNKKYCVPGGEGCVSVDDKESYKKEFPRWAEITLVGYDDIRKKNVMMKLSGFDAAIAQHELDHLDGILFYDHIKEDK